MHLVGEIVAAILIAALGGAMGAYVTLKVLESRVKALEDWKKEVGNWRKNLEERIVFKDTCDRCKNGLDTNIQAIHDDIKGLSTRIDRVLERVK